MGAFADYAHQLVPCASGWLLTVVVWGATVAEVTLAVLLLAGWWPQLVGAATCLVLVVFGTAMAVSLGIESPSATASSPRRAQPRPTQCLTRRRPSRVRI